MSILSYAGFDIFPSQANAGNTLPVHGAGITGTPYATAFPVYASNANNLVGVSGLPEHKIGSGAKLRNALVCHRLAGSSTHAMFGVMSGVILGQGAWSRVINFTVKDISATDINTAVSLATIGTSAVALNGYLLGINSGRAVLVNGAAVPGVLWERNREYAVEIKMWRVGNEANNVFNIEVRFDGAVIQKTTMGPVVLTSATWFTLGMNSNTNINTVRTLLYSDVVISDGDYLGPVQVLPLVVSSVPSAGGWEKEGSADPVATLNDRSDATFYTSPTDAGALSVKTANAEDPAVSIKAAQFFVRSNRDKDAGRAMQVTAENASGTTIAGPVAISNTTTFADYQTFNLNSLSKVGDLANTTLKISAVVP